MVQHYHLLYGNNVMTLIAMQGDKVVMRDGKVGTGSECCCKQPCCCEQITLNDLLYGTKEYSWKTIKPTASKTPQFGNIGAPPEPFPQAPAKKPKRWWTIRPACLRWVCRCVNGNGAVVCSKRFGGATINDIDLAALVINALGNEPGAGCYVYTVEFFGWDKDMGEWVSRDDIYNVYRTKVTSCQ